MKIIPSYLDRYPAKMVTTLADKIIDNYVDNKSLVLDPFCGSSAILKAAKNKNCSLYGFDINPYAILLSQVKLMGFDKEKAKLFVEKIIMKSKDQNDKLPTSYDNIEYWFTKSTLDKLLKLRYNLKISKTDSPEGRAVLLAFALTIRLVSRADQRSPKPFISKKSIDMRKGKHFDPFLIIIDILQKLSNLYGDTEYSKIELKCLDSTSNKKIKIKEKSLTHIITSPPYINAQDYFRNSKLELFLLEDILPFSIKTIQHSFIGTERGELKIDGVSEFRNINRVASIVGENNLRLEKVVLKYFSDINKVLDNTYSLLKTNGKLILVCGDNVVAGKNIKTWQIINQMAESKGYEIIDSFKDKILNRSLAPNRMGHKSLIKDEKVTVFKKI
jgi:DNA modification methylase